MQSTRQIRSYAQISHVFSEVEVTSGLVRSTLGVALVVTFARWRKAY
jgi:hypothetical protein